MDYLDKRERRVTQVSREPQALQDYQVMTERRGTKGIREKRGLWETLEFKDLLVPRVREVKPDLLDQLDPLAYPEMGEVESLWWV